MKRATQIGIVDGRLVYKDRNGDLCVESNALQHLRYLTDEEEARLLRVSKQLKNLVVTEEHTKP